MAGKLDGKVAVVTGASSGIGEATALALAAEGAKVAASARRKDRLDDLVRRITDAAAAKRRRLSRTSPTRSRHVAWWWTPMPRSARWISW